MDRNAYRDENDTAQPDAYQPDAYQGDTYQGDAYQPDAYWRRRVITLCAGLALLGLLAWAFSGGGGKPAAKKGSEASGARPAAAYSGTPTPGADTSPGANASASAGSSASLPFLTASPSPGASTAGASTAGASTAGASTAGASAPGATTAGGSASASAKAARGAAAAANAAAGPASGVEPGGGCAPNAIVLSLFTSKSSYHGGQYPVFAVYAVSTASRACSFDISPAKLHVQVSSSGRVIWDSADCTRGQPDRRAELRRGVPAQESLSWNRTISLPGCVTVASSARPGTYQVQARDASVASPVRTFKLAH
jgi:hypothetical protein